MPKGRVKAVTARTTSICLVHFDGQWAAMDTTARTSEGRWPTPSLCWVPVFSNHTVITPKRNMIQVDYDRMQLGKSGKVKIPVWGEIGAFCMAVTPDFKRHLEADDQITELAGRWDLCRGEK